MNTRLSASSAPLVAKMWSLMTTAANNFCNSVPFSFTFWINSAVNSIPIGPRRRFDSGDYLERPGFISTDMIRNFVRRYIGPPRLRAMAWEEFAIFLQRWGWRMSDLAYDQAYNIRTEYDLHEKPKDIERVIFESKHFRVVLPGKPLIDRLDGGHLIIYPKVKRLDRMHLSPEQIREFIPLCMAVGRAFQEVINESGVAVERLNWMDMGNWNLVPYKDPRFHLHIFGRARGSRFQIHGEFNQIPPKGSKHYDMINLLNPEEVKKLKMRLPRYFEEEMAKVK